MKKFAILSLACVIALAGATYAQDCTSCSSTKVKLVTQENPACQDAKKAAKAETLSAQIVKLEAGATKGCEQSKAKLAAAKKACGTECSQELKTKVAAYEKGSKAGCEASAKALKTIAASLQDKPVKAKKAALSVRIASLAKGAEAGCEKSKVALASLMKGRDCQCPTTFAKEVKVLEANAAKGCKKSTATLVGYEAKLPKAKKTIKVSAPAKKSEECSECPATGQKVATPVKKTDECSECPGTTQKVSAPAKKGERCGSCCESKTGTKL